MAFRNLDLDKLDLAQKSNDLLHLDREVQTIAKNLSLLSGDIPESEETIPINKSNTEFPGKDGHSLPLEVKKHGGGHAIGRSQETKHVDNDDDDEVMYGGELEDAVVIAKAQEDLDDLEIDEDFNEDITKTDTDLYAELLQGVEVGTAEVKQGEQVNDGVDEDDEFLR